MEEKKNKPAWVMFTDAGEYLVFDMWDSLTVEPIGFLCSDKHLKIRKDYYAFLLRCACKHAYKRAEFQRTEDPIEYLYKEYNRFRGDINKAVDALFTIFTDHNDSDSDKEMYRMNAEYVRHELSAALYSEVWRIESIFENDFSGGDTYNYKNVLIELEKVNAD